MTGSGCTLDTRYNPYPDRVRVPLCQPSLASVPPADGAGRDIAELLGVQRRRVVLTSSGRAALATALLSLGAPEGSEVLVCTFNCARLLQAILDARLVPVLVDTAPGDVVPGKDEIACRLTDRTVAVVAADVLGRRFPRSVCEWCEAHGVVAILDRAQSALDSAANDAIQVLSFGRHKPIVAGVGGAVVVPETHVEASHVALASLDIASDAEVGALQREWFDDVLKATAAPLPPLGHASLDSRWSPSIASAILGRPTEARRAEENWNALAVASSDAGLQPWQQESGLPFLFFGLRVPALRRFDLARDLAAFGVETTWLYLPLDLVPRFARYAPERCSNALEMAGTLLFLPCRGWLTPEQVSVVTDAVRQIRSRWIA